MWFMLAEKILKKSRSYAILFVFYRKNTAFMQPGNLPEK